MSDIDKATAAAALRAGSAHCDEPGHPDFGRTLIHCMMSFTSADWDLDGALELLARATEIAWVNHRLGHELGIFADGRCHYFDVRRPKDEDAS